MSSRYQVYVWAVCGHLVRSGDEPAWCTRSGVRHGVYCPYCRDTTSMVDGTVVATERKGK